MKTMKFAWLTALASSAIVVAGCGGSDNNTPAPETVNGYLSGLQKWEQFSPPVNTAPAASATETRPVRLDTWANGSVTSVTYQCTTTDMSMTRTPDKIVMFSPDRELLWPGALLQGKSHKAIGSLLPLTIHERTPINVSIPSLALSDNFRVVAAPDQANVNQAIGDMIANARARGLVPPSSINFTMSDYSNDSSFALKTSMSAKYLGFSADANAKISTKANEKTIMVYFVEKMFEVVVAPPQTPGGFFNADFTDEKLAEQISLGRLGNDNLPIYVSNIVYGRIMAFKLTSTASATEIEAALNASYKGAFDASFSVNPAYATTLANSQIEVTSLGGPSKATVGMIASGDWRSYFKVDDPDVLLSTAYPIAYTFRNLGDGSIAKSAEITTYQERNCIPDNTAGFMLFGFESDNAAMMWGGDNDDPASTIPLQVTLQNEASDLSIFYGFEKAKHTNRVEANTDRFMYDVGYIKAPATVLNNRQAYYRGELSFWHRPDNVITWNSTRPRHVCYWRIVWILWVPIPYEVCYWLPQTINQDEALDPVNHTVLAIDNYTTADQVILRGGSQTNEYERLTLTYNPKNSSLPLEWKKYAISLSNDDAVGTSLCEAREVKDPDTNKLLKTEYYGCWLVEDRPATEYEIQYVLGYVTELKLRASNAVHTTRDVCTDASCTATQKADVLLGYTGSYFDEIKLTKPESGF